MYGSYRFKAMGEENISILAINGLGVVTLMAIMYVLQVRMTAGTEFLTKAALLM